MSDVTIYIGDSRNMSAIEDESVDFIICSPPLWDHLIYSDDEGQIGNISDYCNYLKELEVVWSECYRVLKEGKFMAVIAHDFYIKDGERLREIVPLHIDIFKSCTNSGFEAYDIKIINPYPKTIREFLPEDKRLDSRRKEIIPPRLRYLLVVKKKEGDVEKELEERLIKAYWQPIWDLSALPKVLGSEFIYRIIKGIYDVGVIRKLVPRLIVECSRRRVLSKKYEEYAAVDSMKIYEKAITTYTKIGDLVLDPFVGSGTAGLAAAKLGRKCIGYEINRSAISVMRKKLKGLDFEVIANR